MGLPDMETQIHKKLNWDLNNRKKNLLLRAETYAREMRASKNRKAEMHLGRKLIKRCKEVMTLRIARGRVQWFSTSERHRNGTGAVEVSRTVV